MSAMPGQATRDTEEIRRWAEMRNGTPVMMASDEKRPGAIRINFPGYIAKGMKPISWDEFAKLFRKRHLEFRYEEKTADGGESRFFKLVGSN